MTKSSIQKAIKLLDKLQTELPKHFASNHYLGRIDHVALIILWTTFYRQNMHRFATHYLGLKLYLYQAYMLWKMSRCTESVVIASRAAAKSFVLAIFACCKAILYPKSQIVIASSTKAQAKIIVEEKIQRELLPSSPNLRNEIARIVSNNQETRIDFKNGSYIIVVVANDNARGHRSTVMIYEESRMINKGIIDSVLSQFQHVRDTGFKDRSEYANLPPEESSSIFITSAWYRNHWMWKTICDVGRLAAQDDSTCSLIALDYCISLYHRIKTRKQMVELKRRLDPTTWAIECENLMVGENAHSFFSYEMLASNQNMTDAMYPCKETERALGRKSSYVLPHQDGEIRVLSVDMAFVDKKGNDNSIISCIRALPESVNGSNGYHSKVVYLESTHGGDTVAQALRIKQLFYELNCDYCVLDMRNGGIAVYDMLARPMWDSSASKEYRGWTCMNDENTANRVRTDGAENVVYAINASLRLNSDIAMVTYRYFSEHKVDLLIPHARALDDVLSHNKDYMGSVDIDDQLFYEKPYLETQAFINESIALVYERMQETGIIRISEQGNNTKDRYTSVSYGLYFISLMELDGLAAQGDYEAEAYCD